MFAQFISATAHFFIVGQAFAGYKWQTAIWNKLEI